MTEYYVEVKVDDVAIGWTEVDGEWFNMEKVDRIRQDRFVEESEVPECIKKAILIMKGE